MKLKKSLGGISLTKSKFTASYDFSEVYKSLIDKISPDNTDHEVNISNIELIIWGALFLETKINTRFEFIISIMTSNMQHAQKILIWDAIKYKNAKEKLELILKDLKSKQEKDEIIRHKKFYLELTEIRNRLTHYKEFAVEIPEKYMFSNPEELPNIDNLKLKKRKLSVYDILDHILELTPDPKIKLDLNRIDFDSYKKNIYSFGDWITNLY